MKTPDFAGDVAVNERHEQGQDARVGTRDEVLEMVRQRGEPVETDGRVVFLCASKDADDDELELLRDLNDKSFPSR